MQPRALLIAVVVSVFLAAACTPERPTVVTTAALPAIESGGLGLSRAEWDRSFGPPVSSDAGSGFYRVAWDSHASVIFTHATPQAPPLVSIIDIRLSSESPSLEEARDAAMKLLPNDAVFLGTSTQDVHRSVIVSDLLASDSIRQAYRASCSPYGKVSDIAIGYRRERSSPRLSSISVSWGCLQR
jgi:hypothetical protein